MDDSGTFLLTWWATAINNVLEEDSNIVFHYQLFVNGQLEWDGGFNISHQRHYDNLWITCFLELDEGDKIEIICTAKTVTNPMPSGGAIIDGNYTTRNFQIAKMYTPPTNEMVTGELHRR